MKTINWIREFSPGEWPEGVIEKMEPDLFHKCLFPLRREAGIAMFPSQLARAHVREEPDDAGRHSTMEGKRLSDATDMHVKTYAQLLRVFMAAQRIRAIGGIGLYFDTNTPMFHIDGRGRRVMWVRGRKGIYTTTSDPAAFYRALAQELPE